MAQNFLTCDREQALLLPPDLRDWLPADHLFTSVLALCAQAGLVEIGVIAVDGTKISANASMRANRTYEQIAREILEEAAGC